MRFLADEPLLPVPVDRLDRIEGAPNDRPIPAGRFDDPAPAITEAEAAEQAGLEPSTMTAALMRNRMAEPLPDWALERRPAWMEDAIRRAEARGLTLLSAPPQARLRTSGLCSCAACRSIVAAEGAQALLRELEGREADRMVRIVVGDAVYRHGADNPTINLIALLAEEVVRLRAGSPV